MLYAVNQIISKRPLFLLSLLPLFILTFLFSQSTAANATPIALEIFRKSTTPSESIYIRNDSSLICPGDSVRLEVGMLDSEAVNVSWSPSLGLSCRNCPDPIASPDETTLYQVRLTDAAGMQLDTTVLVRVGRRHALSVRDSVTLCPKDPEAFFPGSGMFPKSGFSYVWRPSRGLDNPLQLRTKLNISDLAEGSHKYELLARSPEGCMSKDTLHLQIEARNELPISGPASVCAGPAFQFSVAGQEEWPYYWEVEGGRIAGPRNQAELQIKWEEGLDSGQVRVYQAGSCSAGTWKVAFARPVIKPDLIISPTCSYTADGTISIQIEGGKAPYTYAWPDGQDQPKAEHLKAGPHDIQVTDAAGCQHTETIVLGGPDKLELQLIRQEDASCGLDNGLAVVKAEGGTGSFSYQWHTRDGYDGIGLDGLSAGDYPLSVEDARGCRDSMTIHIASRATARAMFKSFPEADQPICLEAAQFKFVNHTEDAEAFHWDFGDGQSATESSPEHTYHQPGQYQVILTTQEAGNPCPATDTLLITIAEDGELWIPETFTPNNDGINDAFRLHGPGVEELEFNIYDKNGELVHTLKSLEDRWTGTNHKGKNLPSGQYSYTLFARISNCHTQEKEGLITLKR